jgi:Icc-related predicted phosphoesterase
MATFAVFGDIHGRITLMLVLARRWEEETGRRLDGILQVGDFGAFPDVQRLDKATAKHAARDTDELGFSEYLEGCEEGERLLGTPGWPVVWMRGNHEDFEYLSMFLQPTAVDPWGRLVYVPDGASYEVAGVRVGAMGGKPEPTAARGRGRRAREAHRKASLAALNPTYLDPGLAGKAYPEGGIDVLLTHGGPDALLDGGSAALTSLTERVAPRVALFGHHHTFAHPTTGPGGAFTVGLDHLEFRSGRLQKGCWGILELTDADVRWSWGHLLPWNGQMQQESYRGWMSSLS